MSDNDGVLGLVAKIAQLVGIPAGLFFGGWIVHSIEDMKYSLTRIDTQVQERTTDRYTATDAKHDFAVIDVKIQDLTRRIGVLEDDGKIKK